MERDAKHVGRTSCGSCIELCPPSWPSASIRASKFGERITFPGFHDLGTLPCQCLPISLLGAEILSSPSGAAPPGQAPMHSDTPEQE